MELFFGNQQTYFDVEKFDIFDCINMKIVRKNKEK